MPDNNKLVQVGHLALAGSGISATATSIQVQSLKKPGTTTNITMTDFGDTGYGALEPNSPRWENFSFTGITQNGDGTATFTGVTRGLDFVSPYTADASLRYPHAGGTEAIITNTGAFYNEFAIKDNDETVTGTWTFTSTAIPIFNANPTFTDDKHLISKKYADDLAFAGAPDGSETTKGVYEAATQTETDEGDDVGTTTAPTIVRPSKVANAVQRGVWLNFTETASGDDAYTATTTPSFTPDRGTMVMGAFATANTTGATFSLNGETPVAIQKVVSGALGALETGDIIANVPLFLFRTASVWVLMSPGGTMPTTALLSEMATFFGATDITGAEAEILTNGSNADAKHVHAAVAPYFEIHRPLAATAVVTVKGGASALSEGCYTSRSPGGTSLTLERLAFDSNVGMFRYNGSTVNLSQGTETIDLATGATYVWTSNKNAGNTDTQITRYNKDLTGLQAMTISGTASTDVYSFMTGNDSVLYLWVDSAATLYPYTISGTTATRGVTVTLSDGLTSNNADGIWFDGTSIYTVQDGGSLVRMKKYNTSGTLQSTTDFYLDNAGDSCVGMAPGWNSSTMYLILANDDEYIRYWAISKP